MATVLTNRLMADDPAIIIAQAEAQRGPIVAGWIRRGVRRIPWPRRDGGLVSGPGLRGSGLVRMLPLGAGYLLSYLFRNVNGLIAPDIMRDLGVGADTLGLLTSVLLLVLAAAQIPVGMLLDRYGPARVQSVLLLFAAAGSGLSAVDSGFVGLLVGRALIGLGTAGCLVAGLKASAVWFPRERLAWVNGGLVMCGGLGALAATWPVEFVLRFTDWRGLAGVLAVLALTCAVAVRRVGPVQQVEPGAGACTVGMGDIARDPLFRRFTPLSASCFGTVLAVQGLWAGPWLADVDGLSRGEIASCLASMAAVLVIAAPCWGVLTQWLRPHVPLTRVAAVAAVALLGTEALLLVHPGVPSLLPWCVFAAFGGFTVLSYSVLADHFPTSAIGRANGALNVSHVGVSFVVQIGIGQILGHWVPVGDHYPAAAYRAGLLLPMALQAAALVWFVWPRATVRDSSRPALGGAGDRMLDRATD